MGSVSTRPPKSAPFFGDMSPVQRMAPLALRVYNPIVNSIGSAVFAGLICWYITGPTVRLLSIRSVNTAVLSGVYRLGM